MTNTDYYKKDKKSIDLSQVNAGETVKLDYIRPKNGEYFSHRSPFYFKDMDYDGEDELVVNNLSMGSRGYNTYDVFKVLHVEKPLRLQGLPFTDGSYKITNYNVEYEPKTQCVLDKRYDGLDAYGSFRYKSIPSNEMNGLKRVFVLIDAEDMGFYHPKNRKASDSVNLIQPYKKYERINGKLELVERGVYESGNYGWNNVLIATHNVCSKSMRRLTSSSVMCLLAIKNCCYDYFSAKVATVIISRKDTLTSSQELPHWDSDYRSKKQAAAEIAYISHQTSVGLLDKERHRKNDEYEIYRCQHIIYFDAKIGSSPLISKGFPLFLQGISLRWRK